MKDSPVTGNAGRYWRVAWSSDWRDRNPWSTGGQVMPYVGHREFGPEGACQMWVLGPLAVISVDIPATSKEPEV